MKNEFLPHKESSKLKMLGFDEPCWAWWHIEDCDTRFCYSEQRSPIINSRETEIIGLPLYQQVFEWFREKCGYYVEIFVDDNKTFGYLISYFTIDGRIDKPIKRNFDDYRMAELECIKELIQIQTDKNTTLSKINNESNVKIYNEIIDEVYNNYWEETFKSQGTEWVESLPGMNLGTGKMTTVYRQYRKEDLIQKIKTDSDFSKKFKLKIKEKELSLTQRRMMVTQEMFNQIYTVGSPDRLSHIECDQWDIPKKLITIKYKKEIIKIYI